MITFWGWIQSPPKPDFALSRPLLAGCERRMQEDSMVSVLNQLTREGP